MAIYYIDYNRGNDSNDGLSVGAPWKELTKLDDAAKSAGDMILLANDSIWTYPLATRLVPPATWTGTKSNPVIIGKYSPLSAGTGKPTIKWRNLIAAGDWTYSAPNNAWAYTAPGTIGAQCLVRLGNSWAASRADPSVLPLESVDGRYSHSGTTFYLYAPAGTDPTTYYGGVLFSTEQGFITVTSGRECVDIEDLRFEDTGCGILAYSGTAVDLRVNVRRIDGKIVSNLIRANSDSPGQLIFSASGCDISGFGSSAIIALANSAGGMKSIRIFGNNISDGPYTFSQGGIYIQSKSAGCTTHIYENVCHGIRWGTRDKTADGSAIYAEAGADDVRVYRNTVYDSVVAFQDNSGRATKWYSNLVYDCTVAMRVSDQSAVNAMAHEFYGNTCIVGADKSAYTNFGPAPAGSGHRTFKETGTITSLLVKNNVFVNTGATHAAAILTPTITPSSSSYINNAAWGGFTNVARREYTPFTVETSTGSVTSDPLLSVTYRPTVGSPLLGAGTQLGYVRDIEGKQRPNPPSIGAYDVATLRAVS